MGQDFKTSLMGKQKITQSTLKIEIIKKTLKIMSKETSLPTAWIAEKVALLRVQILHEWDCMKISCKKTLYIVFYRRMASRAEISIAATLLRNPWIVMFVWSTDCQGNDCWGRSTDQGSFFVKACVCELPVVEAFSVCQFCIYRPWQSYNANSQHHCIYLYL